MHGNVWQWCADLYEEGSSDRVSKGGSWFNDGASCQTLVRGRFTPTDRYTCLGVRLARVPVPSKDK